MLRWQSVTYVKSAHTGWTDGFARVNVFTIRVSRKCRNGKKILTFQKNSSPSSSVSNIYPLTWCNADNFTMNNALSQLDKCMPCAALLNPSTLSIHLEKESKENREIYVGWDEKDCKRLTSEAKLRGWRQNSRTSPPPAYQPFCVTWRLKLSLWLFNYLTVEGRMPHFGIYW